MNGNSKIKKIRILINIASKKFSGMNKGSRILLKIGAVVFLLFLIFALLMEILLISGVSAAPDNLKLIEWAVIECFRFWAMMGVGAVILDILINR